MDDAVTILQQIIEGHPWTEESARTNGFGCADGSVSQIVRSAAFDDDAAWNDVERDFEELVLTLAQKWGLPTFGRALGDEAADRDGDFFAAPCDWPRGASASPDASKENPSNSHAAIQLFRESERAAGWQRGDILAYAALEVLDNTRIRALVVGVLAWES